METGRHRTVPATELTEYEPLSLVLEKEGSVVSIVLLGKVRLRLI